MKTNFLVKNILDNCIIFLLFFNLFIPVSNQLNTMNTNMIRVSYIMLVILLSFIYFINGTFVIKQRLLILNSLIVFLLILFTLITKINYPSAQIGLGEVLKFLVLLLTINAPIEKIGVSKFANNLLFLASLLILITGLLMVFKIQLVNDFLKTYYVNHYAHVYTSMIMYNKPVTFFATHSVASYIYFLFFLTWELKRFPWPSWIRGLFRIGFIILLILCKSVSSILCIGLIGCYYLYRYRFKITKKQLVVLILILISVVIIIFRNSEIIIDILYSSENGIIGRYSGKSGALIANIEYILSGGIPTGFISLEELVYTDSGYIVYTLRGGIFLNFLIYLLLYHNLKKLLNRSIALYIFFIALLLFDVGYPVLLSQRFIVFWILSIIYISDYNRFPSDKYIN